MPVLDAVLFDLDGTLTDPEVGIVGSFRHALATVGHDLVDVDDDLRWTIGPPIGHNFERLGVPGHLHAEATAAFRARHLEVGLFEAALVPGMVAVLDGLRDDEVPLALATAKPVPQAVTTLEHFGLADRFAVVSGAGTDGYRHDKLHIVADALERLGGPEPARVAMVGDRRHDVEAGRGNGCVTVAVGWGFAEDDELDLVVPDHAVADPVDLLTLLRALP